MTRGVPPRSDEFELSIIGPGFGECVVVHLGDNEWCVIDSCVTKHGTDPVSVNYLSAFGESALSGVRLLVATHWHDDHIRGISSALRAFSNARFCCSLALNDQQFVSLVQKAVSSVGGNSGVDEFSSVFALLKERHESASSRPLVSPVWALQDRVLLRLSQGKSFPAELVSMSPSDATVKIALAQITNLIPQAGQKQRRISTITPNDSSVVLRVQVGERVALLGADLEHRVGAQEGWFAVISSIHANKKSAFYKVAHHGSVNGDTDEIWTRLLEENPIAVVTPWAYGNGLPQARDLERLKSKTTKLYCTAQARKKPPKRDATVEKMLRGYKRIAIEDKPGHVRIRCSLSDLQQAPEVELFHGAFQV